MNKRLYMYMKRIYQNKWKINMELYFLVIQNSKAGGILTGGEV